MPKNINSASRLVALLRGIPAHPDNTQTLEVWATLFQITEQNPNRKSNAVAERLSAMYRELEAVREQMQKAKFSENLYAPAIGMVEHALSTMLLPSPWGLLISKMIQPPESLRAGTDAWCMYLGQVAAGWLADRSGG